MSSSTAIIETAPPFSHTFELRGVTEAVLKDAEIGKALFSPDFDGHGHKWRLSVYLGGDKQDAAGHISIHLQLVSSGTVKGRVGIAITASAKSTAVCPTPTIFSVGVAGGCSSYGYNKISSHAAAAVGLSRHGNKLAVTMTFQPVGSTSRVLPVSQPPLASTDDGGKGVLLPALPGQLRTLLGSSDGADVVLTCGGERFPAHSLILSLRSPVLKALLARRAEVGAAAAAGCSSGGNGGGSGRGGGNGGESGSRRDGKTLPIVPVPAEIEPSVLRKLLDHLYTDESVAFSNANEARGLPSAAVI